MATRIVPLLLVYLSVWTLSLVRGDEGCKPEVECSAQSGDQLTVKYNLQPISCGSAQNKNDVSSAPEVFYSGGSPGDSNGKLKSAGQGDLMAYAGPTPPANTGYHRYQFLLYDLPDQASISGVPTSRGQFNLADFLSTNQLSDNRVAEFEFKTQH
ncbi:hypothetical protein BaRGS_00028661 [Batillaria attramentaria]|uniref:Phosphatidylethanolamine-binding protein n=1 Tax=Batillaria attramentaria TaxID=370345 RepID=A0ABD0JZ96_9CAEN